MLFDYNGVRTFTDTLQVDDIGNCAIKCEGTYRVGRVTLYGEYYLVTKTVMGKTSLAKFGPIDPDLVGMASGFELSFKRMDYKEAAISKEIQLFLNDGMKGISKAEEVTDFEAFEAVPSLEEAFRNA